MSGTEPKPTSRTVNYEWKPFYAPPFARSIAQNHQEPGEKLKVWPCQIQDSDYYLAVYASTFLPPPSTKHTGFVLLDKNFDVVRERSKLQRAIRAYRVWFITYLKAPIKHGIIRKWVDKRVLQVYTRLFEQCQTRLQADKYEETLDPAEKQLGIALRKLDQSFVAAYDMLTERVQAVSQFLNDEEDLWRTHSVAAARVYVERGLVKLEASNKEFIQYLKARVDVTYEAQKALSEYTASRSSHRMSNFLLATVAAIASAFNLSYGLAIAIVGGLARLFYSELTSYKRMIVQLEKFEELSPKFGEIKSAFSDAVPQAMLRDFEVSR
ncbi:MAG: hypothetical protein JRN51_06890 [Nitrososphaerota archaeon]|nr:hypothetical protein [Ferrimicrobium acidiphilum]MDG6980825.1 hypothetical protein [Nitrososphaerota archaeon]